MNTATLTETEFLNREIRIWGFDYIEGLIDSGYSLMNTSQGWKWILPFNTDKTAVIDPSICVN